MRLLYVTLILLSIAILAESQIEGLYCGKENCYDILGVTREDDRQKIMRAYRNLARINHPDRQRTEETKKAAELKFREIATAYEILRDDEQRKEYDYMLDNPDEMYYHYYQYYRRRYAPKVDVRIVITIIISLISIVQYYGQWSNYNDALKYFAKDPKYRLKAKDIAKSEGLLDEVNKKRENGRKKTKEEIKMNEENLIKKIIEEKMDIKGGYAKPTLYKVLWLQIFLFPYWVVCWIGRQIRWVWLYKILKREYSREDKMCIIKRYMRLPSLQWELLDNNEKEYYFKRELWIKENFEVYRKEKEIEQRAKLAADPSYKRYRRYLKKGGPGQITFGQEDVDMDYS